STKIITFPRWLFIIPEGFLAPGASKWEDAYGMTQGEARCHSVRNLPHLKHQIIEEHSGR
ncbi:MAG: hypothetical protein ACE5IW_06660, partial [bacterium]